MRILVTNDDGIDSEGIGELSVALSALGEVTVVAPLHEQSAVSRSITFRTPLRVTRRNLPVAGSYAVTGTPADCVFLALHHLLDFRPDLLVSGINTGPNLGDDILYSGTVAGALEGALTGIPAVAISAGSHHNQRYDTAASWLVEFLRGRALTLPAKTCLNINVPNVDLADIAGWRYTHQGHTHYAHKVVRRQDPSGREYFWLSGDLPKGISEPGSDVEAVSQGFVSVTPLGMDLTNRQYLEGAPC
jgi:5'-nucleotidase